MVIHLRIERKSSILWKALFGEFTLHASNIAELRQELRRALMNARAAARWIRDDFIGVDFCIQDPSGAWVVPSDIKAVTDGITMRVQQLRIEYVEQSFCVNQLGRSVPMIVGWFDEETNVPIETLGLSFFLPQIFKFYWLSVDRESGILEGTPPESVAAKIDPFVLVKYPESFYVCRAIISVAQFDDVFVEKKILEGGV